MVQSPPECDSRLLMPDSAVRGVLALAVMVRMRWMLTS